MRNLRKRSLQSARMRPKNGFTLVEVILAIGIVVSLLIVALLFYRQAADLRNQILAESERCSTIRLLLDRMALELRETIPEPDSGQEFDGNATSLSFVRPTLAVPSAGKPNANDSSGLIRVTYAAVVGHDGTNQTVVGFDRTEERPRQSSPPSAISDSTNKVYTTIVAPAALDTPLTNSVVEPLTELIRFVRFRYWDGSRWVSGWTNSTPPPGVEIVLATDSADELATELEEDDFEQAKPDEYPIGAFRRVVFLPAGTAVNGSEDLADEFLSIP